MSAEPEDDESTAEPDDLDGAIADLVDELDAALGDMVDGIEHRRDRRFRATVEDESRIEDVAATLVEAGFPHLVTINGHDRGEHVDLVYQFLRYGDFDDDLGPATIVSVRVPLGKDDLDVASLTGLLPSASLYEREIMDMLGVTFAGHPNPEKLLLPDDYEGDPPLRKDLDGDTGASADGDADDGGDAQ